MNAWIRHSQAGRSLFAVMVVAALALRLLIPSGFMPTASAQGLIVQLCSDMSGKTILIDLGQHLPSEKQKDAADGPCTFAGSLGHGMMPQTVAPLLLPFIYGSFLFASTAIADLTVNRMAAPPPPSQGPPALR